MNLGELQAELRHFAAERDWQPFHTPKNLSTALVVEAAELAEIFQWHTPEESCRAHEDAGTRKRIGEEVADVLLYLLQVADHCRIDVTQAVRDKLAMNAVRFPARHVIARVSPTRASVSGTHVLLDYENVQPSEAELRALVPDAAQVWVFHGPHQRGVEKRYASFGTGVTAVPISKTGKNALDFHLSFYMGYIASRNPDSTMVVVANDKGYEPMLEHARAMGFAVRRQSHGVVKPAARKAAAKKTVAKAAAAKPGVVKPATHKPAAKKPAAAKKAAAKKVAAKKTVEGSAAAKPAATKPPAGRKAAAKAAPVKKAASPGRPAPARKAAAKGPGHAATAAAPLSPVVASGAAPRPAAPAPDTAAALRKLIDSLRKMGNRRPTKPASLKRSLKSFLGGGATDESVQAVLAGLIEEGVVKMDPVKGASYPMFDAATGAPAAQD